MTPDAKSALARTIRGTSATSGGLRARLLEDLHNATETAYRLSVRARDAGLSEAARIKRGRFEAWIAEQVRAQGPGKHLRTPEDFRRDAEKQAAYTWLHRVLVLRLMEAAGLRAPKVVTGGWDSRGYKDFRSLAPALVRGDPSEGYAYLLRLVFEDLALELPGVFGIGGSAGVADLVPMPPATLRHLVESLDAEALATCWTDDMTLGWVYQYWNDPEREALDAKLNHGGKVERHEIASKTQMFTERYMVDWLLQNSLGPMWLAMCRKHGWTAQVEAPAGDGKSTLDRLEERRVAWRAKREAGPEHGGVELTALMPLYTAAERRWAYYVPQPIPEDAVTAAPDSVRDLKLMDPAVGSGHFLVVAFELLVALYHEEARHRGEAGQARWSDAAIVERILEHNLHGIDLDPRAVQIAAAALWLKARSVSPEARPKRLNLVAANLKLSSLPDDDPALLELRREVERETGIPAALTDTLVGALKGADHLGSLLKIDSAVDQALQELEGQLGRAEPAQGDLLTGYPAQQQGLTMTADAAKESLLTKLEGFLSKHTAGDDLGLRLRGEQLAAGVRFVRLVKEGAYDLVVANPPYQGTSKMADSKYIERHYPLGKADLYAAFLLRGLELVREGGVSAMLTMRNWMFIKQYAGLRQSLLETHDLRMLGDLGWGSFSEMKDVMVAISQFHKAANPSMSSISIAPTGTKPSGRTKADLLAKQAGFLYGTERHEFDPAALKVVPEWPLVYWWDAVDLLRFAKATKLGEIAQVRQGLNTTRNAWFFRRSWEVQNAETYLEFAPKDGTANLVPAESFRFAPVVVGAGGKSWIEPLTSVVRCWDRFIELDLCAEHYRKSHSALQLKPKDWFFRGGLAAPKIGSEVRFRLHRYASVFSDAGQSALLAAPQQRLVETRNSWACGLINDLNPSVNIQVGDLKKLPLLPVDSWAGIWSNVDAAFTLHESHREPSVEFKHPGPSPWRHAQEWAQLAVDRPQGAPLPEYLEQLDPEPPTDHISFALGVALGRFGPAGSAQEGILDPRPVSEGGDDLSHALPAGLCFLDRTLATPDRGDSLGHPAAAPLHAAWAAYSPALGTKRKTLRDYLALDFFKDVHKGMYENRPIHWPLSSADKTFVAWVNIHRMDERTLRMLHADHLAPALKRLEGELNDLRTARDGADAKAAREAEKRFDAVLKAKNELAEFIAVLTQCADRGAPPTDPNPAKCPPREVDARYAPDLDDGVMINSAALWPLLLPQWKDPKKWWTELAQSKGRKDYDWSHLAMRYWPTRVDKKCQKDPSLGVAHGCFWAYHPARAWAWELRLQDEIGPAPDEGGKWTGRIEEASYRGDGGDAAHRAAYLRDHAQEALAAVEKEALRRLKKLRKPVYEAKLAELEAAGRTTAQAKKQAKAHAAKTTLASLSLLEPGLWSALPEACWELEDRVINKQERSFRLHAPDEAAARAAYEASHSDRTKARRQRESKFSSPSLFDRSQP